MNRISILSAGILAASVVFYAAGPASSEKSRYTYLGVQTCRTCHSADAIGNQYKVWESSPHAKAYRNLRTEKARAIADEAGIKTPYEDPACLKCHTTGGGMDPNVAEEAVGCEACHGPASGYGDISGHAGYGDKQKDYLKASTLGMYKILGLEGIKLREKMCRRCHVLDRPCAPKNPEERKRSDLALSVIADFVFKHPLK